MAAFSSVVRTVHIYGSMPAAALALVLAATGLLLNNAAEFGLDEGCVSNVSATLPAALLKKPDREAIVTELRRAACITAPDDAFEVDDDEIRVVFRTPGCVTDARIQRADGKVEFETESRGMVGALMDLHRGKNAGGAWKFLIDAMAVLLAASALTGTLLAFTLPARRVLAIALLIMGAAAAGGAYYLLVP